MLKENLDFFEKLELKNNNVCYLKSSIQIIDRKNISEVKSYMLQAKVNRFRICLHNSNQEKIQRMILFYKKNEIMDFHWQESGVTQYSCIEGKGLITIKENNSDINYILDQSQFMLKLSSNKIRKSQALSDFWIFYEICEGPFKQENTKRLI